MRYARRHWWLTLPLLVTLLLLSGCGSRGVARMENWMMNSSGMMREVHGRMMGGQPALKDVPTTPSASVPADAVRVDLTGMRFAPSQVQVKAGTTVIFTNRDSYPHRVVQSVVADLDKGPPGFVSPVLQAGQSWAYTFKEPGTVPVLCDVAGHHLAGMVGEIEVVAGGPM